MALTPDEEKQLEHLLRKKYCEESEPSAQPAQGSAKLHGDKIDVQSDT